MNSSTATVERVHDPSPVHDVLDDPRRHLDWRRLRSPGLVVAFACLLVASVALAARG